MTQTTQKAKLRGGEMSGPGTLFAVWPPFHGTCVQRGQYDLDLFTSLHQSELAFLSLAAERVLRHGGSESGSWL